MGKVRPMQAQVERLRANDAELHDSAAATSSRDLILDAAEKLMGEKGYATTPILRFVRNPGFRSGLSTIGNNAGILAEVLDRGTRRHFAAMADAAMDESAPELRLRRYFKQAPKLLIANVNIIRIMITTLQQPPDSSIAAHAHAAVELAGIDSLYRHRARRNAARGCRTRRPPRCASPTPRCPTRGRR